MKEKLFRQLLEDEQLETMTGNVRIKTVYRGGYWYGGSYITVVTRGKREIESFSCESPEEAVKIHYNLVRKYK